MALWNNRKNLKVRLEFSGPDHEDSGTFIRSFCSDYKIWNDHCMALSGAEKASKRATTGEHLSELYSEFVTAYTLPSIKLQLIAYGTDATFDPSRLPIGSLQNDGNRLKQTLFIKSSHNDFSDEYFAILTKSGDGTLTLEQIYYVDPFPEDYAEGEEPILPCL